MRRIALGDRKSVPTWEQQRGMETTMGYSVVRRGDKCQEKKAAISRVLFMKEWFQDDNVEMVEGEPLVT